MNFNNNIICFSHFSCRYSDNIVIVNSLVTINVWWKFNIVTFPASVEQVRAEFVNHSIWFWHSILCRCRWKWQSLLSGLLQCTVLGDASRNKISLKCLMVGKLCQLCERAPLCSLWNKLWPWRELIQTQIHAFNLRTCKKVTNCCLSIFHQQQPLFSTAWKNCIGCEVIVRWAHAFLFWPCLPTTMCSTHLHLFIFTASYNQWYRDIP